jgi:hypothetical protein
VPVTHNKKGLLVFFLDGVVFDDVHEDRTVREDHDFFHANSMAKTARLLNARKSGLRVSPPEKEASGF